MAISTSFKQKCPSCEALVPIKDGSLIGKKIDCPKCKYKFLVESPAERDKETVKGDKKKTAVKGAAAKEAITAKAKSRLKAPPVDEDDEDDDEEPRAAKGKKPARVRDEDDDEGEDEEEGKKKKKGSGSNKFTLGVALAAVGVVVLGVAAYFILAGNSSNNPAPAPAPGPQAQNPAPPNPGEMPQPPGGQPTPQGDPGTKPPKAPDAPLLAAGSELTNLLPNDTEHVFHVFFKDLLDVQSPLRKAAFETPGAFVDGQMRSRLGFSPLVIDDLIRAEKYTGTPWAFTVIHCLEKLNLEELKKALALKPAKGSPIKNQEFFEAKPNPWLEQFARMAFGVPLAHRHLTLATAGRPLYVRLHNSQTVVFADREPLVAFLQADGQFKYLTQPMTPQTPTTPGGVNPMMPGGMPMPGGGPTMYPPGTMPMPGGGPPTMPPGATPTMPPGAPPTMPPGATPTMPPGVTPTMPPGMTMPMGPPGSQMYPPGMGPMGPGGQPPTGQPATPTAPARYEPYMTVSPKLKTMLERMETLSDAKDKVLFSAATDLKAARVDSKLSPGRERVLWYFRPVWDVTYLLEEKTPRIHMLGTTLHVMKKDRTYQLRNEMECGKGKESDAKALQKDLHEKVAPEVIRFLDRFLGHKVELVKMATTQPTMPGGPMMPGGPLMPGGPMMPGGPYPPGYMPPGATPMPPGPMGPGYMPMPGVDPNQKPMDDKDEPENSRIRVLQKETFVAFSMDLLLDQVAYSRLFSLAELLLCGLKGETDMALGETSRQQLSRVARIMAEKGLSDRQVAPGAYPPGAFKRPASALRTAREPNNRVSWMAGLLPFIGQDNLYSKIQFEDSWKDPANWLAARTLIPQFLDPQYPDKARYIAYSEQGLEAAATHFVGIAGVGLDAADYPPNDPAYAHKRGVFGYNQSLRLDDVKAGRGQSNTILMIQVPHDGPAGVTPWLAGGGSTVRGVPEKNSIGPFVLGTDRNGQPITYNGRRGTYALMVDGSVRFIDKDISDAAFQAMCTVKGPAPEDFNPAKDKKTPLVEEPKIPDAPKEVITKPQPPIAPPKKEITPPNKETTPPKKETTPAPKSASNAPPGWQEYVSPEGGFAVMLPSNFKTEQQLAPGVGTIPTTMALDLTKKQAFVTAFFNPPGPIPATVGDKEFADLRKGLLGKLAGKAALRRETPLSLGKHPGREYELDAANGMVSLLRLYIVGGRVYMLNATVAAGDAAAPEVQRFFNSFRLTQ